MAHTTYGDHDSRDYGTRRTSPSADSSDETPRTLTAETKKYHHHTRRRNKTHDDGRGRRPATISWCTCCCYRCRGKNRPLTEFADTAGRDSGQDTEAVVVLCVWGLSGYKNSSTSNPQCWKASGNRSVRWIPRFPTQILRFSVLADRMLDAPKQTLHRLVSRENPRP